MVISSARRASSSLFSPGSRSVVLKSLGLTLLLFLGLWFGLYNLVSTYLLPFLDQWSWLATTILWFLGVGVVIGAAFLIAPTSALFAGLFLDEVAEQIEVNDYPDHQPGMAVPLGPSLWMAAKFGIVVLLANLIALILVWFAGFGLIVFFLINGYLLGQEFFKFAAMRFQNEKDVKQLSKQYSLEIFLAGLIIAAVMTIPIINLVTPVFATIMMVHLYKALDLA
jgi:CysZ protein